MTEEKFLVTSVPGDLSENRVREHFTKRNKRVKHVTQEAAGKFLVILILDRQEDFLAVERDCNIDDFYVDIKRFPKYLRSKFLGCDYLVTGSLTVVKVGTHIITELLSKRDLLDTVSKAVSGTQGHILFWIQIPEHVGLSVVKHKLPRDTGSHFGKICTADNFEKGFRKLLQRKRNRPTESDHEKAESDQALSKHTTNEREIVIPGMDRLACKFLVENTTTVQNTDPELLNCKMSMEEGLLTLRIKAVNNPTSLQDIQEKCLAHISQLDTARVALPRRVLSLFETSDVRSLIQALFDRKLLRCYWLVRNDAIWFVAHVKDHNAIREIFETTLEQRQMPLSKPPQSVQFHLESRLRERLQSRHSSIPAVFFGDLDEDITIVDVAKHVEADTNIEETVDILNQLCLVCRLDIAGHNPDDQRTVRMVDASVNTMHASSISSSSLAIGGRVVTATVESSSHRTLENEDGRDLSLTIPKTAVNSQVSSSPTGISSDAGISPQMQCQHQLDHLDIEVLIRLLEQLSPLLDIGRFHLRHPSFNQVKGALENCKAWCSTDPNRMIDALLFLLVRNATDCNTFADFRWLQELDTLNGDQLVKLSHLLNIKEAGSTSRISVRHTQQLLERCKGIGLKETDRMIHALITYFQSTVRTPDQQLSPRTVAADCHSPITVVGSDRNDSACTSSFRRGSQDSCTDDVPPILPWARSNFGPLHADSGEYYSAMSMFSELHVERNTRQSEHAEDIFHSCFNITSRPEPFSRRVDDHSINTGQQQPLDGAVMDLFADDIPSLGEESHA